MHQTLAPPISNSLSELRANQRSLATRLVDSETLCCAAEYFSGRPDASDKQLLRHLLKLGFCAYNLREMRLLR